MLINFLIINKFKKINIFGEFLDEVKIYGS